MIGSPTDRRMWFRDVLGVCGVGRDDTISVRLSLGMAVLVLTASSDALYRAARAVDSSAAIVSDSLRSPSGAGDRCGRAFHGSGPRQC